MRMRFAGLAGLPVLLGCACAAQLAAAEVRFREYILAPPSRTVLPRSVYGTNGTVAGAQSALANRTGTTSVVLNGTRSSITYDFGKNIAGWVTLVVGDETEAGNQTVQVTFSESSLWISGDASDATADAGLDEPLVFDIRGAGNYTAPWEKERGGFRYLSVVKTSPGAVQLGGVSVHFTAMPHWPDDALQNYTGWFHSSDEQLNRIWYAGAYTNQLVTIDPSRGDALVHLLDINSSSKVVGTDSWYNNYTITNGTSCLTDGAKRDRLVWAGDMAIAVPALAVSTMDLISVRNSLDSLFAVQNATTGMLPYAGVPFAEKHTVSFTYHLYSLIGIADYHLWSGDAAYVAQKWPAWKRAMAWALSQVDATGLANVTSAADWLRFGMGAHNIEANAILHHALAQGTVLARLLNDSATAAAYAASAAALKAAANALLWDEHLGLYTDNQTTALAPQDGNVWAVKAGVANETQALLISRNVRKRWTKYGAPAPEAKDAISPFVSGFELESHFGSNQTETALALVRAMWGDFMLDDPRMTNSTFIEGYSTTGELHYSPYTNDARISHAHGWATGPTSSMTTYIAGLQLLSDAGATWSIAPQLGDLSYAEAGFRTALGTFSSSWRVAGDTFLLNVTTPAGTVGRIGIPTAGNSGTLTMLAENGTAVITDTAYTSDQYRRYWINDVPGGSYSIRAQQTASGNFTSTGTAVPPSSSGAERRRGKSAVVATAAALVVGALAWAL